MNTKKVIGSAFFSSFFSSFFLPLLSLGALGLALLAASSSADNNLASSVTASSSQSSLPLIKINQVGFLPASKKVAVVPATNATRFSVIKAGTQKAVLTSTLSEAAAWAPAQERRAIMCYV
jgi:hypothetical protein